MIDVIEALFRKRNVLSHKNQGITVCSVENQIDGIDLAAAVLYEVTDKKTVLYLSGGGTPKNLYAKLSKEEMLTPGAVGIVDERFGPKNHPKSNELMIKNSGLLRYLEMIDIPFYPILQGLDREETAKRYDEKIREMNAIFPNSVAIVGIGTDGHTAGLPAQNFLRRLGGSNFKLDKHSLVTEHNDTSGKYGERVTMTFLGLEMMDLLIVLVFGEDKKDALEAMFSFGSEQEIPARFYKRPEIARKTLLITDQRV